MPTNVIMPQMGESIVEGTITKWLKNVGDKIKRDEPLFEISTDKVDTEIPAPASGVLQKIVVQEGETVQINTVVAVISESGTGETVVERKEAKVKEQISGQLSVDSGQKELSTLHSSLSTRTFSSPLVRRIAREENIDLAQLSGTGLNNRITKRDIFSYLEKKKQAGVAVGRIEARINTADVPATQHTKGKTEIVHMTQMRQKIAEHMVMSKRTSPHVTTVFEVDMSKIVALYEREKDYYANQLKTKLTYTHFFAKAIVGCIKEFPIINSSVEGNSIAIKHFINLGIAVALPEGLIVPVVKGADEKDFLGLARAINDIAERARTKKLTPDDVQGGTFTITNPGIYGGLFGTPIISQPQVAIVGIGGIKKRAVVINDAIAIRPMVYLALSFDHRAMDGAVSDQFMARLKQMLENWEQGIR